MIEDFLKELEKNGVFTKVVVNNHGSCISEIYIKVRKFLFFTVETKHFDLNIYDGKAMLVITVSCGDDINANLWETKFYKNNTTQKDIDEKIEYAIIGIKNFIKEEIKKWRIF